MTIKTCKQHTKEPVFIYAACAGCEIQRYRDQEKALKAENESLKQDAMRFRWLRMNGYDTGSYHAAHEYNHNSWFEHLDDAAIDAAIADE